MTQSERISLPIWRKFIIFLISLVLFSLQMILFFFLFETYINYNSQNKVGILYILTLVIGFFYVGYIISKPISTNYKLTWSVLILVLPIPFCLLYSLNSTSRRLSKRKRNKIINALNRLEIIDDFEELLNDDSTGANLAQVIKYNGKFSVYKGSKFTFFNDALDKHNDFVMELKKAKSFVLLEYFIISDGKLMDEIFPILSDLGNKGIKIYILYDDVGSRGKMNRKLVKKLSKIPNCLITNYEPLGFSFNPLVNYRDHRKIAVIDGRVAYCGGDNLSDEYIHKSERFGFWRDNCGKYEGKVVNSFIYLFIEMWYTSTKNIIKLEYQTLDYNEPGYIIPFGDGPTNNNDPSFNLFLAMISSAKKYIYISTPYFIIDDALRKIIALKARSGVKVVILMPKIPDKKSAYYMGRENYKEILATGGQIFEFTPGFNHAKNIIVDDSYAFIGTINMDYRSLFLHYECGALIINNPEILKMKEDFVDAISKSEEVTMEKYKKRPIIQRLIAFVLNLFAPLF